MKLHHSPSSPFARKVMIVAHLLGLADRLELIRTPGDLTRRDPDFRRINPSGQIPVLIADDGTVVFDSPVICAYLDMVAGGGVIGTGDDLWRNQRQAALADTMVDAALQCRYETALRPEALRWPAWIEAWRSKIVDGLDCLETEAEGLRQRMDIGTISVFCALAYLDFRLGDLAWRDTRPGLAVWFDAFAAHPAVAATAID